MNNSPTSVSAEGQMIDDNSAAGPGHPVRVLHRGLVATRLASDNSGSRP